MTRIKPGTVVTCLYDNGTSNLKRGEQYVVVSQRRSTGSVVVKHVSGGLVDGLYFWTRFAPVDGMRERLVTHLLGIATLYTPEVVGDVVARDTRMALRRRLNGDGR